MVQNGFGMSGGKSFGRSLRMKTCTLFAILLLAAASGVAAEKPVFTIIELPRPNSGTFSFEQAETRKSEILTNVPTPKQEDWKNPYWGFCIHIEKDDSLTVYGHSMKEFPRYKSLTRQTAADIKRLATELPLGGNPGGVLITSDVPLKDSKAIQTVLKVLFVPSIQLFYAQAVTTNAHE
jgi:hypothetical protein